MSVLSPIYPSVWVAAFGRLTCACLLLFKTFRPDELDASGAWPP